MEFMAFGIGLAWPSPDCFKHLRHESAGEDITRISPQPLPDPLSLNKYMSLKIYKIETSECSEVHGGVILSTAAGEKPD